MSNHPIKPLGDRLLIRRSKAQETKGGILLPGSAQEKPREGEVIAVGPGKRDDAGNLQPLSIKVGDTVLFGPYAGTEVSSEEELIIMSESDVLGMLV